MYSRDFEYIECICMHMCPTFLRTLRHERLDQTWRERGGKEGCLAWCCLMLQPPNRIPQQQDKTSGTENCRNELGRKQAEGISGQSTKWKTFTLNVFKWKYFLTLQCILLSWILGILYFCKLEVPTWVLPFLPWFVIFCYIFWACAIKRSPNLKADNKHLHTYISNTPGVMILQTNAYTVTSFL